MKKRKPVPLLRLRFIVAAAATCLTAFIVGILSYSSAPSPVLPVHAAGETVYPTMTKMLLSSTLLTNIDLDLYKFQLASSSSTSAVAIKQIMFKFSKTNQVSLSNFRLRRGPSDVSIADYAMTCVDVCSTNGLNTDVKSSTIPSDVTSGILVLTLTNAEEVVGSGNVYTLHATVSGSVPGSYVTISPAGGNKPTYAGSLANNVTYNGYAPSATVYHLDTDGIPDGLPELPGYALWSSASPSYVAKAGTRGGSKTWRNDFFIDSANKSQTLSY